MRFIYTKVYLHANRDELSALIEKFKLIDHNFGIMFSREPLSNVRNRYLIKIFDNSNLEVIASISVFDVG